MNLILLFDRDFEDDTHVVLTGRRLDHITTVHRAQVDDTLRVGKLSGKMGEGRVTAIDAGSCRMEVALDKDPPAPLPLTLLIALPRPKALRRIVETAAAMGIKRVYIMESWRVEKSFWNSPFLSEEKLAGRCMLGLEQACDTAMPVLHFRRRFRPFVEDEVPGLIKGSRAFVAHPVAVAPCPRAVGGPVTLAVGPEGGFIPFEVELLEKHGFEAVNFGPRILRTEAFVPAAVGRLF
ncbi:MAG TPA: 16S rRNA (uracil(1498)-N(3))-methyltransferase [Chitinivibrionales bacterium]|jgi:RsmE family RNA methyltransferase|nr:16S rRNA (uracil(1498)-N(3))-methyltransferase [Chitinivibrionales bacterium]